MNSTPLNILLADDDSDDCNLFKKALEELPLATELTIVRDGKKLLSYLKRAEILPDILFLDISMPHKTGIECLAEIHQNEKMNNIHVVMFTTSYTIGDHYEQNLIDILKKTGAFEFIRKGTADEVKPLIYNVLVKVQEKMLLNTQEKL